MRQSIIERIDDRLVMFGDHTKQPKDGQRMPGVETLHQDSETCKPSFFRGHHWGCLSLLGQAHGKPSGPMPSDFISRMALTKDLRDNIGNFAKNPITAQIWSKQKTVRRSRNKKKPAETTGQIPVTHLINVV